MRQQVRTQFPPRSTTGEGETIELIGNISLGLAVLVAALAGLFALASARFEFNPMLRASRTLVAGYAVLIAAASVALVIGFLQNDFRIEYIAHYSERALPLGYKLAAFWAGQSGSLLFWALVLAVMAVIYVFSRRRDTGLEPAAAVVALSAVLGFFAALMIFAANPFKLIDVVPADGNGLNPMLQDPGMIAHPPILFFGYAGFTIPFAMMIGALVAGRRDNDWVVNTRRWTLASWLFLTIGIILGAQWAYVELGWGGYWAWDPVENASLLPWLTGTALLHSIIVQQHRGMLKLWNVSLIAATFLLCIFGTYITRSGVIASVHSFGQSLVGTFFLAFLVLTILFSIGLIAVRSRVLRSENSLETLLGREGMFLAINILLVGMTAVTLVGTMFPVLSRLISEHGEITVSQSFYNKIVAPLGLVLVALMAAGPLLAYGKDAGLKLLKGLIVPGIAGVLAAGVFIARGVHNFWAVLCILICAVAIACVLIDLVKALVVRVRVMHENPLSALVNLIDSNHRRYGGQTAHVGVLMIVAGIIGSSLFSQKADFQVRPGDSFQFAGYTMQFTDRRQSERDNYLFVEAPLNLTDSQGRMAELKPERRQYSKWEEQPNSEVALHSTWREDIYVTLAGWEDDITTFQVIVNPLVSWIWIGGIVMTIGALLALLPRVIPFRAHAEAVDEIQPQQKPVAPAPAGKGRGRPAIQAG